MGDVADDMMNDAMDWAYNSEVCENGHRYLPWEGCYQCELDAEKVGEVEEKENNSD